MIVKKAALLLSMALLSCAGVAMAQPSAPAAQPPATDSTPRWQPPESPEVVATIRNERTSVLITALAGGWLWRRPPATVATAPPPVSALAQPVKVDVLPVVAAPSPAVSEAVPPPPSPAAVSAAERLRESVEGLAQRDRAHQLELEQQRAKVVKELQRAEEARRKAAEERAKPRDATMGVWSAPIRVKVLPAK